MFACSKLEKLNPAERKAAPGVSPSLVVDTICFVHVPLPVVLVFVGENLHSAALDDVEQDPAYTDISPVDDMDGTKAVELLLVNGKVGEIVSIDKFD